MLANPATLRRLAEQHNYPAIRDLVAEAGAHSPAERVLEALALANLGSGAEAREILKSLDLRSLELEARVDLAAVHMSLGGVETAVCILECARLDAVNAGEDRAAIEARLLARLAWCKLRLGEKDNAIEHYQQSIARHPHLAAYEKLLELYREDKRLEDMEACLADALSFWATERNDWPDEQRSYHDHHLREMRLLLWLDLGELESAEDWIEQQRDELTEDQWCALAISLSLQLAKQDRHAAAEAGLQRACRHYPTNPDLHRQAAELAFVQGRVRQAVGLLHRAIDFADRRNVPTTPLWLRLANLLVSVNPALARKAAERAEKLLSAPDATDRPPEAGSWNTRLEVLFADLDAQEGKHEAAQSRYRRILETQPEQVQALQGLGRLAMHLGRFDESATLFERVHQIDSSLGYGDLINLRQFPADSDSLERVEAIARTPALTGSVQTGLLFQLASAWEQRENSEIAFELVHEANAISKRTLNYDPKAHRQHCARIRHAFPADLFRQRAGSRVRTRVPVFIVGMPRSGTTLVEQIVAGHSRIHGAGELGTIPSVIAGLERWERRTGSGRQYPDCVDDLDSKVLHGIAENVLTELKAYSPEADHIVDKLPHNFVNIGIIKLLFPDAKIISVRRDPRDIAVSNYFTDYAGKHGGMGFAYDLDWIGEQLADHNLLMQHWQQLFPEDILEVHYEVLLADPEAGARQLLNHIGVAWEPAVLDFHTLQRPVKTASVWQVRQPLYQSSKARWRQYERHLAPLIEATNRKIEWQPIEMATLPEPGWLNIGVDLYKCGDLDASEYKFRQLLHHLPDHAAARYMLGVVCTTKGHYAKGIPLMADALDTCPWNRSWRDDLAQAYRLSGNEQAAADLLEKYADPLPVAGNSSSQDSPLDYLYLSEQDT